MPATDDERWLKGLVICLVGRVTVELLGSGPAGLNVTGQGG